MNLATYEDYEYLYTATGKSIDLFTEAKRMPPPELLEARSYIRETIDMKLRGDDDRARETETRLTLAQNALDTWGRGDVLRDAIKHVTDSPQTLPDEPKAVCPTCGKAGDPATFCEPNVEKMVFGRDAIGKDDDALINQPGSIERVPDDVANLVARITEDDMNLMVAAGVKAPTGDVWTEESQVRAILTAAFRALALGSLNEPVPLSTPLPEPNPDEKHSDAPHDGEPGLVYPSYDEHKAAFDAGLQAYAPEPADYPNTAPDTVPAVSNMSPSQRMAARIAAAREIPPSVTNVGDGPELQPQRAGDGSEV